MSGLQPDTSIITRGGVDTDVQSPVDALNTLKAVGEFSDWERNRNNQAQIRKILMEDLSPPPPASADTPSTPSTTPDAPPGEAQAAPKPQMTDTMPGNGGPKPAMAPDGAQTMPGGPVPTNALAPAGNRTQVRDTETELRIGAMNPNEAAVEADLDAQASAMRAKSPGASVAAPVQPIPSAADMIKGLKPATPGIPAAPGQSAPNALAPAPKIATNGAQPLNAMAPQQPAMAQPPAPMPMGQGQNAVAPGAPPAAPKEDTRPLAPPQVVAQKIPGGLDENQLARIKKIDYRYGMALEEQQNKVLDARLARKTALTEAQAKWWRDGSEDLIAGWRADIKTFGDNPAGRKKADENFRVAQAATAAQARASGLFTPEQIDGRTHASPEQLYQRLFTAKQWEELEQKRAKEVRDEKRLDQYDRRIDMQEHREDVRLGLEARRVNIAERAGEDGQILQGENGIVKVTIGGKVIPIEGSEGLHKISDGKTKETFTPKMGEVMAALADAGVALPAGFRSKDQQIALYSGILAKHPDMTAEEIVQGIKKGQIEFGAQKKETQTAANVAGKVQVFANELDENIPLVRAASLAVPRGKWTDLNKLMQTGDEHISDPALKTLKGYINATMSAYDGLAARGGTDAAKRAEAHKLLLSADSAAAFEAPLKVFENEARIAKKAAYLATKSPELADDSQGKGGKTASKAEFDALPSGATFKAPDGSVRVKP